MLPINSASFVILSLGQADDTSSSNTPSNLKRANAISPRSTSTVDLSMLAPETADIRESLSQTGDPFPASSKQVTVYGTQNIYAVGIQCLRNTEFKELQIFPRDPNMRARWI